MTLRRIRVDPRSTVFCNHGSAFMEIKVSRSDRDFINLLPSVTLMSPADSKLGFRKTGRRKFGTSALSKAALSQKWDRVLIICRQPFKPSEPFGLAFLYLYTTDCTSPNFISPICSTPKSKSYTSLSLVPQKDKLVKLKRKQPFSLQHRLPSLKAATTLPSSDLTKPGKARSLKRKPMSLTERNAKKLGESYECDNDDGILMRSKVVKQKIEAQELEAVKPKSAYEAVYKALNDAHALDMMPNGINEDNIEISDGNFMEELDTSVESYETGYGRTANGERCDEKQSVDGLGCYQRRRFLGLNGMSCKREDSEVDFTKSYTDKKATDKEMLCNMMSHVRSTESRIENITRRYAKLDRRRQHSNERKRPDTTSKTKIFQRNKAKAIQGGESGVAVFSGFDISRQNNQDKENKGGTMSHIGVWVHRRQTETEFEVESKLFVATLDFKTIDLDIVTFGDIRMQFEATRGSPLVSKHQKKVFLKIVEQAVDDVTN
ncbi:uncharacterized protein LOC134188587 isoform X2 [Corticium candelabrum]|uniref:uncharacterized protein LOC134188587 isoform X2 n=1 Tax=Corticium candelabrum TaxID=121492 RepID=UPI002E261A24|nr:uncharacterized protein LOC134188587 isoform X2 [Corticium candelabrum]